MLPTCPYGSCSHVTSPESKIGVLCCSSDSTLDAASLDRSVFNGVINDDPGARRDPWLYPLFESCETLRFSRIMHDHMLPILYGPSLIRKIFGCALDCTLTSSTANRKRLVHGCHVTDSSPYTPVTIVHLWYHVEAA
ncbi:hypothetical protein TNCV_2281441 [Trichonephila clavipes]|nr:hypothetical protein TNCV_2281441 [Trichonephila clavipes]